MSHIVQIQAKMHDPQAIAAALPPSRPSRRPSRAPPGCSATAPPVCSSSSPAGDIRSSSTRPGGAVRYDNYGGAWGELRHLERLTQIYAVEKASIEARKQGHSVVEESLADGSIRLVVQVGGAS